MKRHKLIWYVILSVSIFRCTTFNDRKLPYYLLYKIGPGFFSSRICCFSYKTQCITKIDESRVSCLHVYGIEEWNIAQIDVLQHLANSIIFIHTYKEH